jgi:predicted porin
MQKKLIAAAIATLCAVPAFAQSSVTIYGRVDMGYQTFTNDGRSNLEDQESSNRWGLMGEEDLGGGLKAFFQLENRFFLDNGNQDTGREWKDKAWVGLKHNKFGTVYLGRVHSAAYAVYGGKFEAFGGDTIGQVKSRRGKITSIWDNGIRYDTPTFGGVKVIGSYRLAEGSAKTTTTTAADGSTIYNGTKVSGRNAYGLAAQGRWGKFAIDGAYQRDYDKDGSDSAFDNMYDTWLVAANYDFGVMEVFGGYAHSKGFDTHGKDYSDAKMTVYQAGVRVPVGAGTILANAGRTTETNAANVKLPAKTHFGVGYWYSLSKRTTLMANLSYDRQDNAYYEGKDNSIGTELAVRHTF